MAGAASKQQDKWTEGMTRFAKAARHNMTAANLAAAGAIALGAVAFAYFWDAARRNAFLENARRMADDMTSWWSPSAVAAPSVNQ